MTDCLVDPASAAPVSVLLITFRRWPSETAGPYGSVWVDTPTWNGLAAEGLLLQQHIIGAPVVGAPVGVQTEAARGSDETHTARWSASDSAATRQRLAEAIASLAQRHALQLRHAREVDRETDDASSAPSKPCDLEVDASWQGVESPADAPFARLVRALQAKLPEWAAAMHSGSGTSGEPTVGSLLWVESAGVPSLPPIPAELSLWYQDDWEELGRAISPIVTRRAETAEAAAEPLQLAEQAAVATLLDAACGTLLDTWRAQLQRPGLVILGGLGGGTFPVLWGAANPVEGSVPNAASRGESAALPGGTWPAGRNRVPCIAACVTPLAGGEESAAEPVTVMSGTRLHRLTTWDGLTVLIDDFLARSPADAGRPLEWGERELSAVFCTEGERLAVRTSDYWSVFAANGADQPSDTSELYRLPEDPWGLHNVARQDLAALEDLARFQARVAG